MRRARPLGRTRKGRMFRLATNRRLRIHPPESRPRLGIRKTHRDVQGYRPSPFHRLGRSPLYFLHASTLTRFHRLSWRPRSYQAKQWMSPVVQVFGRRHDEPFHALWRPASKKRQGTKSREVWHWRCCGRYGDLIAAPGWRVDVTPTGCGQRIRPLARLEAYNGPRSKRLKRIKERTARRPRRPGREGSLLAWGQCIGTGKWRR
jgi:hypothetical protein